jgi:hypothetical protein
VTAASITLIHSPLVGPGSWRAVCKRIEARGRSAPMPKIVLDDLAAPFDVAIAGGVAAQLDAAPTLLVVHSGAGALVPALANRLPLTGVIFADAILPTPGRSWFDTAPPSLQEHLRDLAQDGMLPPWPSWFGEAVMSRLLPYAPLREAFEADCPPLPLAYFEAPTSAEPLPPGLPTAYLRLSEGYDEEGDTAEALGWPVRRETLHHLALLTHPDRIAGALVEMADVLTEP